MELEKVVLLNKIEEVEADIEYQEHKLSKLKKEIDECKHVRTRLKHALDRELYRINRNEAIFAQMLRLTNLVVAKGFVNQYKGIQEKEKNKMLEGLRIAIRKVDTEINCINDAIDRNKRSLQELRNERCMLQKKLMQLLGGDRID